MQKEEEVPKEYSTVDWTAILQVGILLVVTLGLIFSV